MGTANNPFNFLTSNPIGTGITGLLAALDQMFSSQKAEERNAENERQIREILGGRIEFGDFSNRTFGRLQNQEAVRVRDNIDRIARGRTKEGREIIRKVGEQTRQDLRRSFGNQASKARAQLAGSGLSGTPLSIGIGAGFTTAHADARRRLDEGLATQQFNAFTGLSGERLNALQRNEENVLDTRERSFGRMLETHLGTTGDFANFVNSINAPHPNNNALVQGLGGAAVDVPKRSSRGAFYPGAIELTGTAASALLAGSDERFKRNIKAIGAARDFKGVRPVQYTWRVDEFPMFPVGPQKGVIAQQVQGVFPDVVVTTEQGYLMVDYQRLIALVPELATVLWDMIPIAVE